MSRPPIVDGWSATLASACTLSGVTPLDTFVDRRVDVERAADRAVHLRLPAGHRRIEISEGPVALTCSGVARQRGVERELRDRPPRIVESFSVPSAVTSIACGVVPLPVRDDVAVDRALVAVGRQRRDVELAADALQIEIGDRRVGLVADVLPVDGEAGRAARRRSSRRRPSTARTEGRLVREVRPQDLLIPRRDRRR